MIFRNCNEQQKSILEIIILKILTLRNLPTFDTLLAEEYPLEVELFEESPATGSSTPTIAYY
jgi:hypothetical protein